MADIAGMLDELQHKTAYNPEWKARFLASREEADRFPAFCRICREFGYEIYEMDLISAGEEAYAAMRGAPTAAERILPCWKVKMIIMSCFLRVCK